jgi:hypothetical protein
MGLHTYRHIYISYIQCRASLPSPLEEGSNKKASHSRIRSGRSVHDKYHRKNLTYFYLIDSRHSCVPFDNLALALTIHPSIKSSRVVPTRMSKVLLVLVLDIYYRKSTTVHVNPTGAGIPVPAAKRHVGFFRQVSRTLEKSIKKIVLRYHTQRKLLPC